MNDVSANGVDLYWLPLGAGGHSVRLNGRVYEAVAARIQGGRRSISTTRRSSCACRKGGSSSSRRPSAMTTGRPEALSPRVLSGASGPGRFRIFRYEVRRWRDGVIPDIGEAVDSPRRLTADPVVGRRILDLVPAVPALVWGRDESRAGEMWNSNSLISWLITRSGLDVESVHVPPGGRAPGWHAGIVVAG